MYEMALRWSPSADPLGCDRLAEHLGQRASSSQTIRQHRPSMRPLTTRIATAPIAVQLDHEPNLLQTAFRTTKCCCTDLNPIATLLSETMRNSPPERFCVT